LVLRVTGLFTHRRRSASAFIRLGRLKAPTPHSGKLAAAVFAPQSPHMPPPTSQTAGTLRASLPSKKLGILANYRHQNKFAMTIL